MFHCLNFFSTPCLLCEQRTSDGCCSDCTNQWRLRPLLSPDTPLWQRQLAISYALIYLEQSPQLGRFIAKKIAKQRNIPLPCYLIYPPEKTALHLIAKPLAKYWQTTVLRPRQWLKRTTTPQPLCLLTVTAVDPATPRYQPIDHFIAIH